MGRPVLALTLAVLLAGLACGPGFNERQEAAAIQTALEGAASSWVAYRHAAESDTLPWLADTLVRALWWQTDTSRRTWFIDFAGTEHATVVIVDSTRGWLQVRGTAGNAAKSVSEYTVRTLELTRHSGTWQPASASCAETISDTVLTATANVRSLRLVSTDLDTMLATPVDQLTPVAIAAGAGVLVRVKTDADTLDCLPLLYPGAGRLVFTPARDANDTWVATWTAPPDTGLVQLTVRVVRRRTLTDAGYPYNASAWTVPCRIIR